MTVSWTITQVFDAYIVLCDLSFGLIKIEYASIIKKWQVGSKRSWCTNDRFARLEAKTRLLTLEFIL